MMEVPVTFERRGNKSSSNRIGPGPNLLKGRPPKVFITRVRTPKAFIAKVRIKPKRMVGSQDVVRAVLFRRHSLVTYPWTTCQEVWQWLGR
jgi:hypothetical protein